MSASNQIIQQSGGEEMWNAVNGTELFIVDSSNEQTTQVASTLAMRSRCLVEEH